jgi:hypothetical protein
MDKDAGISHDASKLKRAKCATAPFGLRGEDITSGFTPKYYITITNMLRRSFNQKGLGLPH